VQPRHEHLPASDTAGATAAWGRRADAPHAPAGRAAATPPRAASTTSSGAPKSRSGPAVRPGVRHPPGEVLACAAGGARGIPAKRQRVPITCPVPAGRPPTRPA
jgi:hypothetical protein